MEIMRSVSASGAIVLEMFSNIEMETDSDTAAMRSIHSVSLRNCSILLQSDVSAEHMVVCQAKSTLDVLLYLMGHPPGYNVS